MSPEFASQFLKYSKNTSPELRSIGQKIISGKRISFEEGLYLYKNASLSLLGIIANHVNSNINGNYVYYVNNIHIEYTNLCVNNCAFCAFRSKNTDDAYELNPDQIITIVNNFASKGISEVHIVGGIHPDKDIYFWMSVINQIKSRHPHLHIKAFTAAEIDYMSKKAHMTIESGLKLLKENGLDSIPGGGAEIFDTKIRQKLCPEKISWQDWLMIHEKAHLKNIPSNATMLYGHLETIENRVFHLLQLRNLQDKTNGFNAFVPLKYKNKNNALTNIKESRLSEDLRLFAFSRIFLDNIRHIKAYWPMLGKEAAFLALTFGADDIDGTIHNTTSIFSKAGAVETNPETTEQELIQGIKKSLKIPVKRDALYNKI